ncbi:hypothetical protein PSTG_14467 [Puccinia striiformis f. sp. tritici PST-78]|uniref:Uncharacterized protein n=1 Tax=Puccinia striiformis f. sp. tritici PST-78 TaxID=1165861 RepID=A0A0L0UYL0_9BASI|nr:hypothetical protein PSTG_14467 [Puccinia striiformis f. sp. tritici PST-78]
MPPVYKQLAINSHRVIPAPPPLLTPEENRNLIDHYLTVVKQQRADNPPPPPFVDPLTTNKQLDGIIKNILANQEAKLGQKIFFNQSLREYRTVKKSTGSYRLSRIYLRVYDTSHLGLKKNLANNTGNPLHKQNLATFNVRFDNYKEALIKAQEIEVQATQVGDKTVILTSKILKIESRPVPTDQLNLPIPEVTGNVHLDKHLAKTLITNKPVNKKEKATKKEILPLDSPFGDSTISSFTTEPYFEDLEPTDNLSSPVLKKIARKPALPILLDSEEELDKDPVIPILNPSTLIPNDEPSKLDKPIKFLKTLKGTIKPPWILGDYLRTPFVGRKPSLQRDGEQNQERRRDSGSQNHQDSRQEAREDPRQVLEGNLERRQEDYLGSSSTEPAHPPEVDPQQRN